MRYHCWRVIVVGLGLVITGGLAQASDGREAELVESVTLAADRPGFGDGTTNVPPLRLALEFGAALVTAEDGLALALPQLLLRFGLTEWIELRLQIPSLTVPIDNAGVPAGTDGGAGFKVAVALHERVGLSWVSIFGVPVAALARGEQAFLWSSSLNVGFMVSDSFGVNATAAAALRQPLGVTNAEMSWELGGAVGVAGTFDTTGLYLEGIAVTDQAGALRLGLGLGVTQMLTPTLQLDLSFDYDLPDFGSTIVVGMGVATLF